MISPGSTVFRSSVPALFLFSFLSLLSSCALFDLNIPPSKLPDQILINPDFSMATDAGEKPPGWFLLSDQEHTINLSSGLAKNRNGNFLYISQDGTSEGFTDVNAWVQRLDRPPSGWSYNLYLEFGTRQVSENAVHIDIRHYDSDDLLISNNSWKPDLSGTISRYWAETDGVFPPGCAYTDILVGLDQNSAGTLELYLVQTRLIKIHNRAFTIGNHAVINSGLRLNMEFEDGSTVSAHVSLSGGCWRMVNRSVIELCDYTIEGRELELELRLKEVVRYYPEESNVPQYITSSFHISGSFRKREGDTISGPFHGRVVKVFPELLPEMKGINGTVAGYLTLGGAKVDSVQVQKGSSRQQSGDRSPDW